MRSPYKQSTIVVSPYHAQIKGLKKINNTVKEQATAQQAIGSNITISQVSSLTDEEKATYGLRCPAGYKKLSVLGRGGCALVWTGLSEQTNTKVAIK
jgi:hypothetical protein